MQGLLNSKLGTGKIVLPSHSSGQSKSQGQPGSKGWENGFYLLMEKASKSYCGVMDTAKGRTEAILAVYPWELRH